MSIILKGIDLPKHDEGICVTIWKDGIVYARDIKTDTTIEAEAEAIQIPTPHGRIKDIDKIKDELRDQIPCCGLDMTYSNSNAFDSMDNAPTILDEEGE